MSEHPLDFLKDYSTAQEDDQDAATAASESAAGMEEHGAHNNTEYRNTSKDSKTVRGKSKKRLLITKKELQKTQIRERRKLARKVIIEKCKCHLSCTTKLTPEQRQTINESYWRLENIEQKKFIKTHTVQGKVKRRRVPVDPLGGVDVKKAHSYAFYLPDDTGQLQAICCTFFLNTLGYRKGCGNHIYRAHASDSLCDKRGKYERDHSLRDAVWDDILSYSPRTYHKGLKYSATALYLPNQLNAKLMHADFKAKREATGGKPGSASFYCSILREMDVHFVEMDDFHIPERKSVPSTLICVPKPPQSPPMNDESRLSETEMPPQVNSPSHSSHSPSSIKSFGPLQSLQPVLDQPTLIRDRVNEQRQIVALPTIIPHETPASFQTVDVKQESYYELTIGPMAVPVPHYTEDNDDFSDSYSNMVEDPDYSESRYHEPLSSVVKAEDTKVNVRQNMFFGPVGDVKCVVQSEMPLLESPKLLPCMVPVKSETKITPQREPIATPPKPDSTQAATLPEGYPPVKRTKKFIAKVRNIAKRKQAHPVLFLECNCHLSCKDKIDAAQQERINEQYWSMGFCDQRMFMLEHTERHSIKRRRAKQTDGVVRKGYTYSYRLTDTNGSYQPVCCQFFLNTIGFGAGSGNVIYRAHQVELSEAISDKRGKFARDTTMRDAMDDDILSYFTPDQQDSGEPLDLSETDWTPKKMYNQYVQRQASDGNNKPGSFGFYWRRVKQMKVLFAPKPEPKASGRRKSRSSTSASSEKHQQLDVGVPSTYSLGF
ncbi:uncharacterized protein LOC129779396 [Toxorhynchites rutilus septentrionalis]|uniref:uncharacterized protein LOC129779396 n=1 Tax=Toxorhynchites rutilus septentrionalis TaxID=329112 RepID=UPI002479AA26|nr:uncharacterized protein LOC129779396 [Toxorhynchites rutilus septentrionalis]